MIEKTEEAQNDEYENYDRCRTDDRGKYLMARSVPPPAFEDRGYATPCLIFGGYIMPNGYGKTTSRGRVTTAHRAAYEAAHDVHLPKGHLVVIDHLCRTPSCINPDHLEAVSQSENAIRGETGKATGAQQMAKTHCPQGHPYSGENLYTCLRTRSNGRQYKERICRTCKAESKRKNRGGVE